MSFPNLSSVRTVAPLASVDGSAGDAGRCCLKGEDVFKHAGHVAPCRAARDLAMHVAAAPLDTHSGEIWRQRAKNSWTFDPRMHPCGRKENDTGEWPQTIVPYK